MDLFNDRYQKDNKNNLYLKTSSEIIKEAKESLMINSVMNARIVKTNRPFTPKNNQRIFFEEKRNGRPTSSISFQKIKYQEPETVNIDKIEKSEKLLRNPKTKLPSLINHKSMTSLEKLPEEFEILPEPREIYSSPTLGGESKITRKNGRMWFPSLLNSVNTDIKNSNQRFSSSDENCDKLKISLNWLDVDKSIQDNKINEVRAILKSTQKDSLHNVIAVLYKPSLKDYKDEEIIELLKKLYVCLEDDQQIQLCNDQHLAKNLILKLLFNLIDSPNEMLLLYVVRIILLLRITGKNLSIACKLVFKISRSDKNDELFLEKNIISSFVNYLGLATPDEDFEALIYGYGALKFLMMNVNILRCALNNGILQLMTLHLKMINLAKAETSNFPEQISHVLFQLTGCLRNVANDECTHAKFVTTGTLTAICKTIKLFISDIDLVVNVARIISILSINEECCNIIVDDHSLHTLVRICKIYPAREDIIVRIMYGLGNVLAICNRARLQLYSSSENTLEVILNLLQFYLEIDLKLSLENTFNKSHLSSIEDVFIKILRVIANMCIDENVGMSLIYSNTSNEKINELLDCLLIILRRKTIYESEELVISTLSTLNNLSYFSHPDLKGPFTDRNLDICEALNSLLSTRHEECVAEIGRVYGNLSRSHKVRKYLLETGGLNFVIDWLENSNKDILLITNGILINMMVEKEARLFLKNTRSTEKYKFCLSLMLHKNYQQFLEKTQKKLIQNLYNYAEKDWNLANLICQVIWNFSIEEDLFVTLGNQQAEKLLHILIELLDEDRFFSHFNHQLKTTDYKLWEEFSVVATNILEKMEIQNISE